jgi:hypothetical protein
MMRRAGTMRAPITAQLPAIPRPQATPWPYAAPGPNVDVSPGIVIRPSSIDGVGVFAHRPFGTGETVYIAQDIEIRQQPALGTVERQSGEHVLDRRILRWVNHSCVANAWIKFRNRLVMLIAGSAIAPGDEIVCDYWRTETTIPMPFRCRCRICSGSWIAGRS